MAIIAVPISTPCLVYQPSKISIPIEAAHTQNDWFPRLCSEIQRTSAYSSEEEQRVQTTSMQCTFLTVHEE